MKNSLKQFLTLFFAMLVLWAGNGYGLLEHSCEEHGKHQHILSNWVEVACEHEHQHDTEAHQHEELDNENCRVASTNEQISFVYFYAETLTKSSAVSVISASPFQATLLPLFVFQITGFFSENISSLSFAPPFRRTFGRELLAWVQSFLI